VAGQIHAGITVSGLGLHFTCQFTSHGSKIARCLPKVGLHREARFNANCKPSCSLQGVFWGSEKIRVLGGSGSCAQSIDALLTLTELSSLGDKAVLQFGISVISVSII
jgi:hypothetical protein